ncbi:hypothetical protein uvFWCGRAMDCOMC203_08 [Freshwater phage uvFW-CGR-AMD-COM-C203]|nr:hypothetical protein uvFWCGRAMDCOMC203_08 [Freshwater phage uvFW-CGR-AMD-COM-C203]
MRGDPMSVTKEFAVKIDTELSSWYDKRWDLSSKLESAEDSIKFYEKYYPTSVEKIQESIEKVAKIKLEIGKVNIEISKLNAIYNQDPWTRAFLVIASNGHVHSSMDCNTCFATTRYNWLVQYSNDDEKTIVEDAGQDACTICYPSAPAEVLNRPSRIVTADKVAKAQAKAERDAKRAERIAKEKANAPTASGEFLTYKEGKYTRVIKTERTAIIEWAGLQWTINQEIVTHYFDGHPHNKESIRVQKEKIIEAQKIADLIVRNLAEKNGVSFDQQLKILNNKYKKRGY